MEPVAIAGGVLKDNAAGKEGQRGGGEHMIGVEALQRTAENGTTAKRGKMRSPVRPSAKFGRLASSTLCYVPLAVQGRRLSLEVPYRIAPRESCSCGPACARRIGWGDESRMIP